MGEIDVSVVVPTRNRSGFLRQALASVLRQEGVILELIVVDEASTDDTAQVLASIRDPRLRILRHSVAVGVAAARNAGAATAHGEWLAFIDDDDVWAPGKLALQIAAADAARAEWVYTGAVTIGANREIVYGRPPMTPVEVVEALPRYNAIPGGCSNVIVRRGTWERCGPFETQLRNTEDWEMWIRLAKTGLPACVARPLVGYRVHATNASLNIEQIIAGTHVIEKRHHTTADWGRLHRWMGESCLRRGQRKAALGQYFKAAMRGEVRGVASDLWQVVRRRAGLANHSPVPRNAWLDDAAHWLREIDRTGPASAGGTTSPGDITSPPLTLTL